MITKSVKCKFRKTRGYRFWGLHRNQPLPDMKNFQSQQLMTGSIESRKEVIGMKTEFLNAKTMTRVGFRNICTMYETGKPAQFIAEMRRYSVHVLGVSECR